MRKWLSLALPHPVCPSLTVLRPRPSLVLGAVDDVAQQEALGFLLRDGPPPQDRRVQFLAGDADVCGSTDGG